MLILFRSRRRRAVEREMMLRGARVFINVAQQRWCAVLLMKRDIILKRYNYYSLTHSKGGKKKGKSPFKKDLNNQKSGFVSGACFSLFCFPSLSLFLSLFCLPLTHSFHSLKITRSSSLFYLSLLFTTNAFISLCFSLPLTTTTYLDDKEEEVKEKKI